MKKHRPFGISILAVFVAIGALIAIVHTLQFLHILPFTFGPISFFAYDTLGAILWGVNAAILIWVAFSLWNLRMEGRLFVLVIATLNLILAFASVIGQTSFSIMLPAILINLIILIYCLTPGVEKAFQPVSLPKPEEAAPPAPAPVVAAVPEATRISSMPEIVPAAAAVAAAGTMLNNQEETPLEPGVEAVTPGLPLVPAAAAAIALASEPEDAGLPVVPAAAALAIVSESEDGLPVEPEAVIIPDLSAEPEAASIDKTAGGEKGMDQPAQTAALRRKYPIEKIEGIGPVYKAKLLELGIEFVADLLVAGASRKGREDLVEKTGISSTLILKWVNMADLMRISGIGEEFSELLEAAGVDTVKELRNRNPENLFQAMIQANKERKMVRRTPYLAEVQSWVKQAKLLETVMTY